MCRPPRIPLNADERTARRSVPATFVGCVQIAFVRRCQKIDLFHSAFTRKDLDMRSRLRITFILISFSLGLLPLNEIIMAQQSSNPAAAALSDVDPFLWLEDVTGEKAIEWVKARNAKSQAKMESDPQFNTLRKDLLAVLDSDARIPFVSKQGDFYYNFWRDQNNERGLWRRTTLDQYKATEPNWELILDLDALGKDENENWVWKGANLLRPDYKRALITLSRGGADADVTREFGPGSMTNSGYPRIAKKWKRGTPIESAESVYEGKSDDMSASHGKSEKKPIRLVHS